MLGNDRRRLELAFSLLFSLPGTPMMQYGDEIGIGDNLRLPERECARTPMQWTSEEHGGFSRARRIVRPVIDDAVLRLREGERRRPAPRSALAPQLDRADDPHAQGMPGDQLGFVRRAPHERSGSARDPLRVARNGNGDPPQLLEQAAEGPAQGRADRAATCSSKCSTGITAGPPPTACTACRSTATAGAGTASGRPTTCWIAVISRARARPADGARSGQRITGLTDFVILGRTHASGPPTAAPRLRHRLQRRKHVDGRARAHPPLDLPRLRLRSPRSSTTPRAIGRTRSAGRTEGRTRKSR